MEYETTDLVRQSSDTASVKVLTEDGSKIYIRNGGVDGSFDVELSDYVPESDNWLLEGHLDGKFIIRGTAVDQINLNGEFYFYGNSDTGDVVIVEANKARKQMIEQMQKR